MRGKGKLALIHADPDGITPAYAGKSFTWVPLPFFAEDHPRLCGEKLVRAIPDILRKRITPAYAGKSKCIAFVQTCRKDHPRLCGEKSIFFVKMNSL